MVSVVDGRYQKLSEEVPAGTLMVWVREESPLGSGVPLAPSCAA